MSVYRCYVEKKPGFQVEAGRLFTELRYHLGIQALLGVRIFNRYDAEGLSGESYRKARTVVFSEPQVDSIYDEEMPALKENPTFLAVEPLPGQFDQRADSCAQCIQLLCGGERPVVSAAKLYVFGGPLTGADMAKIKHYLINPVECREASLEKPETLMRKHEIPTTVAVLNGFTGLGEDGLRDMLDEYGLAMDLNDLKMFQAYFRDREKRDPTITELRLVDTYWSDHCRHTTFGTHLDHIDIDDPDVRRAYQNYLDVREQVYGKEGAEARPKTLMDLGTLASKALRQMGLQANIDQSEEINACSIHVTANVDGEDQDWLLMFKNETHNHPTEIEPFGGAATCIGGCIRDPLSGRAYVYQAMRLTGCGDPRTPLDKTLPGKLPQRKLAVTAAAGYSSYGNQIGLATGIVREVYHPGYVAKHMEVGAVVGAVPSANVVRERPAPGDRVLLLGGRTGRDGIGGATGSSKSHNATSLQTMASEVQKGNAPEERKLQRLFRNAEVTRMIKRCNDFGAGGVSVAIGELADGLEIDLNAVRKKYDGLDGTELAISESQERMAVVVAPEDEAKFLEAAAQENLEAYEVAVVTEEPRLVMNWNGVRIADIARDFLASNGADKHASVHIPVRQGPDDEPEDKRSVRERVESVITNINFSSQRGLTERFDGSIGAASVLMPFGGRTQTTPTQAMAALLPVGPGHTTDLCSVMANGFDPYRFSDNPFTGARDAVITSVARVVAAGADCHDVYLTFQEYFEKLRDDPDRWGIPYAALLGAFQAQMDLKIGAIGGKDSMSGSFLDMDVPPTLVSFAIAPAHAKDILTPEFKAPGHRVVLFRIPKDNVPGVPAVWENFHELCQQGKIYSAWAVGSGSVAEGLVKMTFGNEIGFTWNDSLSDRMLLMSRPGSIIAEADGGLPGAVCLGSTIEEKTITLCGEKFDLCDLKKVWEAPMEDVYPTRAKAPGTAHAVTCEKRSTASPAVKAARPRAVIPVFPGTNCEYDTANACLRAGIEPQILVVRNLTPETLKESEKAVEQAIRQSQIIILPGGFSGGDEPDGSGKFIASFFRNPAVSDAVRDLLGQRDGLMLGICNGFQALIKLGLVPYGEIRPMDAGCPTLTYNLIGRHQSRYVTTRIASVQSPWMLKCRPGDLYTIPVSHGEGRFVADDATMKALIQNGQIATQYCDPDGNPSMDIAYNPNGSMEAVEGIFSPDGRVFGKMGHTERSGEFIAKNIPGNKYQPLFESGAEYFR